MKRLLKYMLSVGILSIIGYSVCGALSYGNGENDVGKDIPYKGSFKDLHCDGSTDLGNCTSINEDKLNANDNNDTIIRKLLKQFGLDYSKDKDLKFIDYVRAIINIALGLLSMIALIMTIYTFYMMFFSDDDAKVKKAKSNLTGIFIALAVIGLAWLIVSFIFRWYNDRWKDKEDEIGEINTSLTKIDYGMNYQNNKIYFTI